MSRRMEKMLTNPKATGRARDVAVEAAKDVAAKEVAAKEVAKQVSR